MTDYKIEVPQLSPVILKDFQMVQWLVHTIFEKCEIDKDSTQGRPLYLTKKLVVDSTSILHEKQVKKHVIIFKNWVLTNEDAIASKDINKFESHELKLSDKVYIDFKYVLFLQPDLIWQCLSVLLTCFQPQEQAQQPQTPQLPDMSFLAPLIPQVLESGGLEGIMKSDSFKDVLNNVTNSLSNGQLDLSSIMGSMSGIMGSLDMDKIQSMAEGLANIEQRNNPNDELD